MSESEADETAPLEAGRETEREERDAAIAEKIANSDRIVEALTENRKPTDH